MQTDIGRKVRCRVVAAPGLLVERSQKNRVQIAGELAAQAGRVGGAVGRDGDRLRVRRIQLRNREAGTLRRFVGNGMHE